MTDNKIVKKNKPRRAGAGRPKGSLNKTTAILKDAVLLAAEQAGEKEGMVGYLKKQAVENPPAFLTLLGKVLPLQVTGDGGGALQVTILNNYGDR
jgi:hypothetical protein